MEHALCMLEKQFAKGDCRMTRTLCVPDHGSDRLSRNWYVYVENIKVPLNGHYGESRLARTALYYCIPCVVDYLLLKSTCCNFVFRYS